MATKKKTSKKEPVRNHMAEHDSFRFALNMAVLAVLLLVITTMVLQAGELNTDPRSKAAGITTYQAE